jgi:short-subunit dehydrogenase
MNVKYDAIVTGGSSGIGAEFASKLCELGLNVLITGRREDVLNATANRINKACGHERCHILVNDLHIPEHLSHLTDIVSQQKLSYLINNAGYNVDGRFHDIEHNQYTKLMDVHINATVALTHAAMPSLRETRGALINVASIAAFIPTPLAPLYGPTKAFLHAFTRSLAANYHQDGIKCLSVCPGFVRTDFHSKLGLNPDNFYKDHGITRALTPAAVVDQAFRDLKRGKVTSVAGWNYKLLSVFVRYCPDRLLNRLSRTIRQPRAN